MNDPALVKTMPADTRIVYGADCTWWDSIDKVGLTRTGLPACPFCGGVLFEVDDEKMWWKGVRHHDLDHPGYIEMIRWARGKCFPGFDELQLAFADAQ